MTPATLSTFLAVPGTGEPVSLVTLETANGEPYQGRLVDSYGNTIGILDKFKFRFIKFDDHPNLKLPILQQVPEADEVPAFDVSGIHSGRFQFIGSYLEIEGYLAAISSDENRSSAYFNMNSNRADIVFLKHPWSGQCEIWIEGCRVQTIDLFNPSSGIPFSVAIAGKPGNVVEVRALGLRHPDSMGTQVIIEKLIEYLDITKPIIFKKIEERNRGGEFPSRFFEIMADVPAEGIVLDIGGGRRQLNDARYVNLEYGDFEEADVYGDATCLPFQNNSVDFVFSAAVMEHVRNPLKMGSEIARVLKPGGVALVNAAFMQPIHSEGQHFFNITPYGLEEAMQYLVKRDLWWDGNLSHMLRWFLQVSKIERNSAKEDYQTMMEIAERMDGLLDNEGLMYIASGVWFEGTKGYLHP